METTKRDFNLLYWFLLCLVLKSCFLCFYFYEIISVFDNKININFNKFLIKLELWALDLNAESQKNLEYILELQLIGIGYTALYNITIPIWITNFNPNKGEFHSLSFIWEFWMEPYGWVLWGETIMNIFMTTQYISFEL